MEKQFYLAIDRGGTYTFNVQIQKSEGCPMIDPQRCPEAPREANKWIWVKVRRFLLVRVHLLLQTTNWIFYRTKYMDFIFLLTHFNKILLHYIFFLSLGNQAQAAIRMGYE